MWRYIESFGDELYRICLKSAGHDKDYADELMSDVVYERLERILELWDPARGPVQNFVNRNIKLYIFKHIQRERKLHGGLYNIEQIDSPFYTDDHSIKLEVFNILETLTTYERHLLWSHFALGISRRELARELGVQHPVITQHLNAILAKIQSGFPSTRTEPPETMQEGKEER